MQVKHKFTSAKADGPDSTRLRPSNWNDDHDVLVTTGGVVLGRAAGAGAGAVGEIPFSQLVPVGVIMPYGGSAAPTGTLLCFGQAVSRTTYALLFAVLGTTFGAGDGVTTFNLPDLRGVALVGKSNMGGADRGNLSGGGVLGAYLGGQTNSAGVSVSVSGGISGFTGGSLSVTVSGTTNGANETRSFDGGGSTGTPEFHTHNFTGNGATSGSLAVGGSFSGSGGGGTSAFSIVQPSVVVNFIVNAGV
jgi:microcystin-dependent protein